MKGNHVHKPLHNLALTTKAMPWCLLSRVLLTQDRSAYCAGSLYRCLVTIEFDYFNSSCFEERKLKIATFMPLRNCAQRRRKRIESWGVPHKFAGADHFFIGARGSGHFSLHLILFSLSDSSKIGPVTFPLDTWSLLRDVRLYCQTANPFSDPFNPIKLQFSSCYHLKMLHPRAQRFHKWEGTFTCLPHRRRRYMCVSSFKLSYWNG